MLSIGPQGQACEGHVHLCLVLSRFPSQSTRDKKVCFLLSLGVSQPVPKNKLPLVQRVSQLCFPFCDSVCVW